MALLVCNIGWMSHYEGLQAKPDRIVGGGGYVKKHGYRGEICNFIRCDDDRVYGHVETIKKGKDRPISIELLGADENAEYVDGIDVVWTATHPTEGGRRVVGWYRNARVLRNRKHFSKLPSTQHKRDKLESFRVSARALHMTLLPLQERSVQLGRGKGWIGQANWWFPEKSANPAVKIFVKRVYALMEGGMRKSTALDRVRGKTGGRWGGKSNPLRNAEVEAAAIEAVKAYFGKYKIKSVEKENLGWDLEASKGKTHSLRLEVKGLFAPELQIGLTSREYRALVSHMSGKMDNYRLCVVTGALTATPRLVVFRYSREAGCWVDDCLQKDIHPKIRPVEAAIISLP